jgi:dihydroflavonol-4-reductase
MILVTGANGLVGSFLCNELAGKGYRVKALVREKSDTSLLKAVAGSIELVYGDITDAGSLVDAMEDVMCVVHTAAVISFWNKKNKEMYQTNVVGTRNVVDVALEKGVKKMIHISSIAAIGRKATDTRIDEKNNWEESAVNTAYAVTKHQAELEVFRAVEEGLHAVIINPSVILGPGLKGTSSVRLFEYVQQKGKFYTDGDLNYVDVRDVVESIEYFISHETPAGERYILNGGTVSFKTFFEKIAEMLHTNPPSVKASDWMKQIVWRVEAIKAFITGKEPLITKSTARTATNKFEYSADKIMQLSQRSFRPLQDTIYWTCKQLF